MQLVAICQVLTILIMILACKCIFGFSMHIYTHEKLMQSNKKDITCIDEHITMHVFTWSCEV